MGTYKITKQARDGARRVVAKGLSLQHAAGWFEAHTCGSRRNARYFLSRHLRYTASLNGAVFVGELED